ncbi:uncharacterized protein LOC108681475 [Hyalella azteca]|uniref:Uncharacterized protein LOC108681475 n=1 Tax=Hyalella azteca TaxID=294128 RepID=A0A8B7PIK9_HYAAZ|nr:uncharacterized protein LOC108681475 [Hyalella azteca]
MLITMKRTRWCGWRLSFTAFVVVNFLPGGYSDSDPIENCKPKGGETILCNDRTEICRKLNLAVIYDVENYCSKGEVPYFNPAFICNCDVICVGALEEGAECSMNFANDYPKDLCGNGLDCISNGRTYTCQRNHMKPCVNRTIAYENAAADGMLSPGLLLPACSDIGKYGPVQCSTSSTCYCTDTDGNRLFGEAAYTEKDAMDCQCSLHWQRNDKLGLTEGMRCLSNGNLDSLQCNEDFCFCYNSTKKAIDQGPYHPTMMKLLDCYNESYHSPNYTNPCTVAEQLYLQQNPEDADSIAIGISLKPNCSLDGFFAAIQSHEENDFICADSNGKQIENFQFSVAEKPKMTCNCARRRHVMRQAGLDAFLPECCPNGNFKSRQTRGLYSFCVDGNGDQVGEAKYATEDIDCGGDCVE